MARILASFAAVIELELRELHGPFAARITMKNGEVWCGRIAAVQRDDHDTWAVLVDTWVWAHGSGKGVRLRTAQMKEMRYQ